MNLDPGQISEEQTLLYHYAILVKTLLAKPNPGLNHRKIVDIIVSAVGFKGRYISGAV